MTSRWRVMPASPSWRNWLAHASLADAAIARSMKINNSAAVLQAATEGQGIALARSVMAREDLAAGRLVRLFPEVSYPSPLSYYVVYRAESAELPKVVAFSDWLLAEAAR